MLGLHVRQVVWAVLAAGACASCSSLPYDDPLGRSAQAVCDDGNPCTWDIVGSFRCAYVPMPAGTACSDGSACTDSDACDGAGVCGGTPVLCVDDSPCTNDSCDPSVGCVFANSAAGTSCSDSSACTTGDQCNGSGACVGVAVDCDDGMECTDDACDPVSGCTHQNSPPSTPCDDGDACTSSDYCDGTRGCIAGGYSFCTDDNPCTADSCDPVLGCVFTPLGAGASCNDNDACTTADQCTAGGACAGTPSSCDDSNLCTTDLCESAVGCVHQPVNCDDGSVCTIDACEPATGCMHQALSCDDANVCTDDTCDGVQGCQHGVVVGRPCSDGEVCTTPDACGADGLCSGPAYTPDDGNACTLDVCTPGTGEEHPPAAAGTPCSGGDPSNGGELCDGHGVCLAAMSSSPVGPADDNAMERRIDGRHPVAASGDAFAVAFSEPVHWDGSPPRLGVAVRSAAGELRGVAWIDGVTMTPHASVAALPDGSFAVVFESRTIDEDGLGIAAMRVSAQGVVLGGAHLVNGTTSFSQHSPDVIATSTGVVVAWEDESQDDRRRICWRTLDASLTAQGADDCDEEPGAWDGFVTLAQVGNQTAVAWQRERVGDGSVEVRIGGNHTSLPLSGDGGPLPVGEAPGLTGLDAGTLLVAYTNGDGVVLGSVIDNQGIEQSSVQLAAPGQRRAQPSLASNGSVVYLVWQEPAELADGGWEEHLDEVFLQQLGWSGGVLDTTTNVKRPVPSSEADRAGDQASPAVVPLSGALVLVWQDLQAYMPGRCAHGDVLVSVEFAQ